MPCTFSKQINEQQLNEEIIQIISKLVADPEFAEKLKAQIKVSTDISTIEIELTALQKKQRNCLAGKRGSKMRLTALTIMIVIMKVSLPALRKDTVQRKKNYTK